jgi:branched-chain amino acid transport system substrate-binding protein
MSEEKAKSGIGRRKFIAAGAGIVAVAAIAGGYYITLPSQKKKDVIKIGVLAPTTGSFAIMGEDQIHNAEFVIDKWNKKGGVLGIPITMVIRDTETKPEPAARRAKELITTERVDFLTGTVSNAVQYSVMEVVKEEKIIWMVGSGTTAPLKMKDKLSRYAWYIYSDVQMFSMADAKFAAEKIGKRAYIVAMDYVWGRLVTEYFTKEYEANGGKVIGQDFAPLGTTDYTPFFPKIMAANPDVLVVPIGGGDLITMIKQAASYGISKKMPLMGINSPTVRDAAALSPEDMENVYCGLHFYWEIPEAKEYVTEFMKKYDHPPDAWGYTVYAGLNELFSAIERAGSLDKDKIKEELEKPHTWNWGKGECYFRLCDHQAIQPWHILKGKSPSEIKGKWDRLQLLHTFSAKENEKYLPTCKELGYE